jgi:hypothetical protein
MPQAQAEPQTSAPEDVQNGHKGRHEPHGDEVVALSVLGPADDQSDGPAAGHQPAEADHDPWSPEPRRAEGERQRERDHGNEIPGHCLAIGAAPGEPELCAPSS